MRLTGPLQPRDKLLLCLVPEPLLMPMRFHALAALMLRNFRFASFFERAHSDFQNSRVPIQPSDALQCNPVLALLGNITSLTLHLASPLNSLSGFHSGNLSPFATW